MATHPALELHPDRLFPADAGTRAVARRLHAATQHLPIISPHGHTDPAWFATNERFANPTELLLAPDHYLYRMLYSQGVDLQALGVADLHGGPVAEPREAWRLFASHWHLFRGTPSSLWLDTTFHEVFGLRVRLSAATADLYYDTIDEALASPAFLPRALFERFGIECLATTESPLDTLEHHAALRAGDWALRSRVITAYRPDPVVDPDHEQFREGLGLLGQLTGEDTYSWSGYLRAHRQRRAFFAAHGATSTDHGHPSAFTADLSPNEAERLFNRIAAHEGTPADHELFPGQILTEMAKMSLDDGLVMQLHPGACRNHNHALFTRYGRDKGADIPTATEYTRALQPLLSRVGNDKRLTFIVFTLDETSYSRELAPLAGHYPALRLGPAWWFHDSPNGLMRFREQTTETAGFRNTVGFNDDTRAFLSIPARHDVARRVDAVYLARLVTEHRLSEDEAFELAIDLAYRLPKQTYRLDTPEPSSNGVSP